MPEAFPIVVFTPHIPIFLYSRCNFRDIELNFLYFFIISMPVIPTKFENSGLKKNSSIKHFYKIHGFIKHDK